MKDACQKLEGKTNFSTRAWNNLMACYRTDPDPAHFMTDLRHCWSSRK